MALQTDIYWATQLNAKDYIYRPVSLSDNPTDYNKWTEMTPEEKVDFDNKRLTDPNIIMCYVDKTKVDTQVLTWYKKSGDTYKKYEGNNWQTITDTTETDALKDTNKNLILVVKSDKVAELKSFESKAIKVTYYLICHGFSCANATKETGISLDTLTRSHVLDKDPLLHNIGIAQSMFLGHVLNKLKISFDAICSSQLQRAAQTAHCINLGRNPTNNADVPDENDEKDPHSEKDSSTKKIYLLPNINEAGLGLDNSPIAYKQVFRDTTKNDNKPDGIVDTCDPSQTEEQCTTELEIKKETFLLELGKRILPVLKDISSDKNSISIGIVVHQNLLKKIRDVVFSNKNLPDSFENTSTVVIPNVSYLVNKDYTRINLQSNNFSINAANVNWGTFTQSPPVLSYITPAFPFKWNDYELTSDKLCNNDDNGLNYEINTDYIAAMITMLQSKTIETRPVTLNQIVDGFNNSIGVTTRRDDKVLDDYDINEKLTPIITAISAISNP